MNNSLDIKIIAKYLTGECSPEEYETVRTWVGRDPKNEQFLKELRKTWIISGKLDLEQNENEAWENLSRKLFEHAERIPVLSSNPHPGQKSKKHSEANGSHISLISLFSRSFIQIAAAIALVIGISWFLYSSSLFGNGFGNSIQSTVQEITTGPGQRVRVKLSDGSHVILNASSTISFPKQFDNGVRYVKLEGEAYFNVNHKTDIPFVIHTDKGIIHDLGTKFDVRAYPGAEKMAVVVTEGKVAVYSSRLGIDGKQDLGILKGNKIILREGQYTQVSEGKAPSVPKMVNLNEYIGWINGKLIFKSTPLNDVLKKLTHYYGKYFVVPDSSLLSRKLTATFTEESFAKVLDVITLAMDLQSVKKAGKNDTFILKPDKK